MVEEEIELFRAIAEDKIRNKGFKLQEIRLCLDISLQIPNSKNCSITQQVASRDTGISFV